MVRGINRQSIFVEDRDYSRYIETLGEYKKEIAFELYAYCLMGNHLHLLIKEGNEKIGNTMRRIGVSYAYWYNRQYDRSGHLFQGRFKSEPVEDDTYFLTVLRYIHQNPVKAGLVSNTADYKWSSYDEYYKTSNIVDTNFALQMFSSDKKEAVAEFGKFHIEITDSRCLDIDEEKKTLSDKDVRDLALDKYNTDLSKLQNMEQEIQDKIIKYLKRKQGISLRQLSRLTGFTIHRIYKVKV
jgi:putative transposase